MPQEGNNLHDAPSGASSAGSPVVRTRREPHGVVAGINQVKKHQRPNPMKGEQGGIVNKDMPIHVSNVAVFNPVTKKADRVGFRTLEDGRKVRFFKSNGELVGA